ncbi:MULTISPECIES: ComEC/Rec2 family competence protein [Frankia]|nr:MULTISPECIES: ComEC/Rec2 family competence protein [Frankia]
MVDVGMETGLALPERPSGASRPMDARLVGPAVMAWAGAAGAGTWPPSVPLLGAAGAVLVAAPMFLLLQVRPRGGRPTRPGPGGARAEAATGASRPSQSQSQPRSAPLTRGVGRCSGGTVVVLTALVFLAAGFLAGGLAARPRDSGPLADLVRHGRPVTAEVVVTDDPRATSSSTAVRTGTGPGAGEGRGEGGGADRVTFVISVRAERLTASPADLRVRAPMVLLARGGGWGALLPSQHLVVSGRLAEPRVGDTVAAVLFADGPPRTRGGPAMIQRIAGGLRAGLRRAAGGLPEPRRGLLPGLVVGDVSGLDDAVRADFRAAGMSHLTAVSGSNVAIVTASALYLMGWTGRGSRSRAAVGALALVGFVVLARPSASVLRAGAMGLVGLLGLAVGRPRAVLPSLAASVIILILADPALALSVGFALSVLATAGMIVLAPGWRDALARRLPARIAEVLSVAAAAQLACTPVLAWTGGGLSLVAVPANVLAVPAVAPATVLGVLTLVVAAVSPSAAGLLAHLADLPCWWLVTVAGRCADLPAATLPWPTGVMGAGVAAGVAWLVVATLRRRVPRRLVAAALVGLLLARCAVAGRLAPWPPPGWRLVACDVGQGDALVLSAGPGTAVLVDAGPDPALLTRCLSDLGVRRIPVVILSHFHADHVEGLPAVLGRLPVGEVLGSPLGEPVLQWHRVQQWTRRAGVPLRTAVIGSRAQVGAVSWTVLAPRTVLHGTESDPNNASLVLSARVGEVTILLTGDVEPPAQRVLTGSPEDRTALRADVLKVPHHGAADQDATFLAATGARFALISVGTGNSYGHPAPSTLRTLRRSGMAVARTDRDGAVAVVATAAPAGSAESGSLAGAASGSGAGVRVSVVLRRPGGGS